MIVNCQRRIRISTKLLAQFCEQARLALGFPEETVGVRLVSDPVISRLNRQFRGKRGPTDVLSFPADSRTSQSIPKADGEKPRHSREFSYVGDIAISPQTAQRNARRDARPLSLELRILILHGMIHLAGYDHEADHGEMNRFERRLRRQLGLC